MNQIPKLVLKKCGREGRFANEWKWHPESRRLENKLLGVAYQIVDIVYEGTNIIHHEAVIYLSRRIELHVIVREHDGYIGLLTHRREKVIPPEISEQIFADHPEQIPDPLQYVVGVTQYECPHGLAVDDLAEAEEETGFAVLDACHIGFVKESPCQGGVAHKLYATMISDSIPSGKFLEEGEQVLGITFFPPEDIKNINTLCGMTQAALWRFRCWGLAQSGYSLWYNVAKKM